MFLFHLNTNIVVKERCPKATKMSHSIDWLMIPTSMMKKAHTFTSAVIYMQNIDLNILLF